MRDPHWEKAVASTPCLKSCLLCLFPSPMSSFFAYGIVREAAGTNRTNGAHLIQMPNSTSPKSLHFD